MDFDHQQQKHHNEMPKNYLTSFQRKTLQKTLEGEIEEKYRQRIKIILLADEGKSQTEICQLLGCCQSTARHWIMMARSGQAHRWEDNKIGRPKRVNEQYLKRLQELVSQSPREFGYSFKRWTAEWLSRHLENEFNIKVSNRYINQLLKQMGLSTKANPKKVDTNPSHSYQTNNLLIRDLPLVTQVNLEQVLSLNLLKQE